MGKYFGTDGFRGEANENLTADHAYKIGRFLGWYYGEQKRRNGDDTPARIVIGKDTRRSSYMFEYTLVGGLVASGADAYLLHVTTTPSVAYVARTDNFDCGIMISASHNPYYDNGIKLINGNGEKMDEETIALVEDYLDGKVEVFGETYEEVPYAHKDRIGCTVDYVAGRNRYVGYLISLGMYSFKGIKVGLDCANGSSWNIAKAVFDALGAKTYVINAQPDGTNINNNAGSTHIEGLQKYVVDNGLEPVEKTIIDRCVRLVYQEYLADPVPEKMPILEDLYNLLRKQEEPEAQRLATSLEIYVTGSLNVFNHQTNVDINNRIVCFDIKELGKQLKKIGMLVIQDQVWNRVTMNRSAHKSTRYYVDEFHLLLKEEQTAAYSVEIWKRFRKWGGIPTGITQNIKDLLSSREIENIFENSDFIYMLNQASGDRQILAKQLNISPTQLSYVTNSNEGEGLLFYGNVIIPFVDRFPKNSLYKIMTTRLEEISEAG